MKRNIVILVLGVLVSLALNTVLFVYTLNLVVAVIKINSGFVSATAVMLMLPIGVGALVFSIFIVERYRRVWATGKLQGLFFTVTSVQAYLLFVVGLLRIAIYRPLLQSTGASLANFLQLADYSLSIGSFAAGTAAAVAAAKARSAHAASSLRGRKKEV